MSEKGGYGAVCCFMGTALEILRFERRDFASSSI
jgi:hypothetical protein